MVFSSLLVCVVSPGSSGLGGRVREVRPSFWEAGVGVRNSSMEAAGRLLGGEE